MRSNSVSSSTSLSPLLQETEQLKDNDADEKGMIHREHYYAVTT